MHHTAKLYDQAVQLAVSLLLCGTGLIIGQTTSDLWWRSGTQVFHPVLQFLPVVSFY